MVAPRTVAGVTLGWRHFFIVLAILCALAAVLISLGVIGVKGHDDALQWFFGSWFLYLVSLFW